MRMPGVHNAIVRHDAKTQIAISRHLAFDKPRPPMYHTRSIDLAYALPQGAEGQSQRRKACSFCAADAM